MAGEFEVYGAQQLERLAKALKGADRELRKELLRRIRAAGKPVVAEMKRNLASNMPQRGGLAADLGRAKIGVRTKTSGSTSGVRIEARHSEHDLASIDRGIVRHPVYGRPPWVEQDVPEGEVSRPVRESKPAMQRAVLRAMDDTADEIVRRTKL